MNVRFLISLACMLLLAGCVSTSDIERMQAQIFDLQDQVAELKRSQNNEVQQVNARIEQKTDELLRSYADLTARVAAVDERMATNVGTVEQTNYRIDRLAQQVTQLQAEIVSLRGGAALPGTSSATPGPVAPSSEEIVVGATPPRGSAAPPSDDPIEIYQSAYRDYQRGNYDLARAGFEQFLDLVPQSDLADNAAYWIGECFFAQKKHRDAIAWFDQVINDYSGSDKVPSALLKKGFAYIEMGERAQGIVQLQYVIHEHPRSSEADIARQRLAAMGIQTP
jgi:tol-pal system protein YbgF